MLTRIRNAIMVERQTVDMSVSKLKRGVAEVLKREGFIWDWEELSDEEKPVSQLRLELKYGNTGEKVIRHIKRVSKPGRRIYSKSKDLRPVLNGLGIQIISPSQGVFSDREARQKGIGGEVIAEASLVDRSSGTVDLGVPFFPLIQLSFPTYAEKEVPAELKAVPVTKPAPHERVGTVLSTDGVDGRSNTSPILASWSAASSARLSLPGRGL